MLLNAYCIYDRKTLAYFPPFFAVTHAAAVRSFSDLATDTNTNVGRHPMDFVLFHVGAYEDGKAALMPLSPIEHVIDASALVQALQQEIPFPEKATTRENLGAANGHVEKL